MQPIAGQPTAGPAPTSAQVLYAYGRALVRDPFLLLHFVVRSSEAVRRFGWRGPWQVARARVKWWHRRPYADWVRRYDTLSKQDTRLIRSHIRRLSDAPRVSVLVTRGSTMAVENSVRSVVEQLYADWEVLIAQDGSKDVTAPSRQPHADRIKVVATSGDSEEGAVKNALLAQASGRYVLPLKPGNLLAPHALYLAALESQDLPRAALIDADEDCLDEKGSRCRPSFRAKWNDELAMRGEAPGAFLCWRTDLVRELGGWREGLAGAADWDLALRVSERKGEQIRHIPHVVLHCAPSSDDRSADPEERTVLESCLERRGLSGDIQANGHGAWRFVPELSGEHPLVSVVVPTRNGSPHLQKCVNGVLDRTSYRPLELLIVDNRSSEPETVAFLEQVASRPEVRVLPFRQDFNFAAINNVAVRSARGSVILLLNDDTEVICEQWLTEMVRECVRPDVGAVGGKLLYPWGAIQHAGIVMGLGWVAGHPLRGLPEDGPAAPSWLLRTREVSAVTAACLAIRKDVYLQVGGMDEQSFAVSFNDVDLCLRLRRAGYRILWTPHAQMIHWESATRGLYPTTDSIRRLRHEERTLRERWGEQLDEDPVYSPNLTLIDTSCSLAFPPRAVKPWRGG